MALSKRTDIRRVSAAAVFAAATLNASPLYLAILSEQTASDAAWRAVAETNAQVTGADGRTVDTTDDMALVNIWHSGEAVLYARQMWTVTFTARSVETCFYHPADANGVWRIGMPEAIGYLAGRQQGVNTMSYTIRAAYLWQEGPGYTCQSGVAEPLCWISVE